MVSFEGLPFGEPLFLLFSTICIQLLLRTFVSSLWDRFGIYITTLGLLASLLASGGLSLGFLNADRSLYTYDSVNGLFATVFLAFGFIAHVNISFLLKKRDHELLLFEVLSLFLGVALLSTQHLSVMTIFLPLLILLISAVPLIFNKLVGLRSLNKGLVYSVTFLLLWSGLTALWLNEAKTDEFSALHVFFKSESSHSLFTGWIVGLFMLWTLLFLPPFQFFDKDYEVSVGWPVFAFFRWQLALLSILLSLKWTFSLTSQAGEWGIIWLKQWGWAYNEIYFYFHLFLLVWLVYSLWRVRHWHSLMSGILLFPLILASLSALSGDSEGLAWSILAFCVFTFSAMLVSSLNVLSGISLGTSLAKVRGQMKWPHFPGEVIFLIVLGLALPAGNQSFYFLMKELIYPWHYNMEHQAGLLGMAICCVLGVIFVARALHKASLNFSFEEPSQSVSRQLLWNYILLIPFIILGIYPFPLYNYVKFAVKAYF